MYYDLHSSIGDGIVDPRGTLVVSFSDAKILHSSVVGGTFFAEGVTLNVSPSVIHHSKETWGPDAREFSPDRWLDPDSAAKEKHFIPWGAGYASCPGQHVARMQLSKISATIIRDYEIRQVNHGAEWKWPAWFTAVSHDWPVYITKRSINI